MRTVNTLDHAVHVKKDKDEEFPPELSIGGEPHIYGTWITPDECTAVYYNKAWFYES